MGWRVTRGAVISDFMCGWKLMTSFVLQESVLGQGHVTPRF